MVISLNPHMLAVIDRLEDVTFGGQPLKVGDGVAPKSTDGRVVAPAVIVHARTGGTLINSVGCLDGDGTIPFQTTSIGRNASEARAVADACRAALVDPLDVDGRWVRCRPENPGGAAQRDDDINPPLFYVITIYRLLTFSAA